MLQLHFLRLETNKQKNISFLCLPWAMCASWSTKRTFIGISHCTQFSNLLPLSWGFPPESMLLPDPRVEDCVRFLAPVAACFLHLPGLSHLWDEAEQHLPSLDMNQVSEAKDGCTNTQCIAVLVPLLPSTFLITTQLMKGLLWNSFCCCCCISILFHFPHLKKIW